MRRFRRNSRTENEISSLSVEECRTIAYYLFCANQISMSDCEFFRDAFRAVWDIAFALGKKEQIRTYFSDLVRQYEKEGKLTPLSEEELENDDKEYLLFDDSDVRYRYEQDKSVNRFIVRMMSARNYGPIFVDVMRVRQIFEEDQVFLNRFIYNFCFRSKPLKNLAYKDEVPASMMKTVEKTTSVNFLKDAVGLSQKEALYLLLLFRFETVKSLSTLTRDMNSSEKSEAFTRILRINSRQLTTLSRSDQKLKAYGFIDSDGDLNPEIIECINNRNIGLFFTDVLKPISCRKAYDVDSFNVPSQDTAIMSQLLKSDQAVSLLLYGKPGSGKTEYAKALAKQAGLKAELFKNGAEIDSERRNSVSVMHRLNCLLSMSRPETVLIIDEADTLLETGCMNTIFGPSPSRIKGTVNKMMEESQNKIIWIVNHTGQIDESTKRRFNFSHQFDSMTEEQLRSIARSKLKPLNMKKSVEKSMLDLFGKYSITGASVDNVLKTLKTFQDCSDEELLNNAERVLKENAYLVSGKGKMRETVNRAYDAEVLNTSMDAEKIVTMVKNARAFSEKHKGTENGIRMLFYGLSGTGKTEFARYLSEQLGKKILLKRASDILNMYVGGSEKNIRNAFEEAERKDMILLFDEADSFFQSRENARNSWEITQVNEFLTQMEEFPGILICTTNLKKIMDPAMNRRFHILVEFKPLSESGIRTLLRRYFDGITFSDGLVDRLVRNETVTPGDFGSLAGRVRFMDEADVTAEYIVDELLAIQKEKSGAGSGSRIGFFS